MGIELAQKGHHVRRRPDNFSPRSQVLQVHIFITELEVRPSNIRKCQLDAKTIPIVTEEALLRLGVHGMSGIGNVTVSFIGESGQTEVDNIAYQRATDRQLRTPPIQLPVLKTERGIQLLCGIFGNHVNQAGRGVFAKGRALRSAQYFYPLQVEGRGQEIGNSRIGNAVYGQPQGRLKSLVVIIESKTASIRRYKKTGRGNFDAGHE